MSSPHQELDRIRRRARLYRRAAAGFVTAAASVVVFALATAASEVARFAQAAGFGAFAAWALDPIVGLALCVVMFGEALIASAGGRPPRIGAVVRWLAGGTTLTMNCWPSCTAGRWDAVLLHAVAPGLLIAFAEAAPRFRLALAELADQLHARELEVLDELHRQGPAHTVQLEQTTPRQSQGPAPLPAAAPAPAVDHHHPRLGPDRPGSVHLEGVEPAATPVIAPTDVGLHPRLVPPPVPGPRLSTGARSSATAVTVAAGTAAAATLTATAPVPDESETDKRRRLELARPDCVLEVATRRQAGHRVPILDIRTAYGAGDTWAKSVSADANTLTQPPREHEANASPSKE